MSPSNEVLCSEAKIPKCDFTEVHPVLKFAKLTENAYVPTRGSKQSAGYDLYRFLYIWIFLKSDNKYIKCITTIIVIILIYQK